MPVRGSSAAAHQGGTVSSTTVDSLYILGGPLGNGDFEEDWGVPSWDGWSHVDLTLFTDTKWQCDTYQAANLDPATNPNHAWWCGQYWEDDCQTGDFGGYGNNWTQYLTWQGNVADPGLPTVVTVQAVLNHYVEAYYDFLYLQYETATGWVDLQEYNGIATDVVVDQSFTLNPGDYLGAGGDEVHLRWQIRTDEIWSDEDCLWPSLGAAQIDLIAVTFDQGSGPELQGTVEDCDEHPTQWVATLPVGVGDFAQVWPMLNDIDPCLSNYTPQVGFIDDGLVVPGTGGTWCTTWCYGPSGYIVNNTGGLAGPEFHLHNEIWSPPIVWPAGGYEGAELRFSVYRHENLGPSSPGMFYVWHVRSTASADPVDLDAAPWKDRQHIYYGGPDYLRQHEDVTHLLAPGRQQVQVALGVYELGWIWGWCWADGTPAPYFDDVALVTYEISGPAIATRGIDLAQDNFPASGTIDYAELAANSVRFDMAQNIAPSIHLRNDPGDSVVCTVVAVRSGSQLLDRPRLYYQLQANPLFDPFRSAPVTGWVYADSVRLANGQVVYDKWSFDLPDTGLLFPGDVMHYYIMAQDNAGGEIGTTLMPVDTTGFADFTAPLTYPRLFTLRALPSLLSDISGEQPPLLFWDDQADLAGEEAWYGSLDYLDYQVGRHYDVYRTNSPSSGVGNGLGGRATPEQLAGYEVIAYSCGDLSALTLGNGDFQHDPSDDIGVLDSWLRQGDKDLFLTGDDLVFDLWVNGGSEAAAFVNDWFGVSFVDKNIRPLIDNQSAPQVQVLNGNPVFWHVDSWIAYGGCLNLNQFDALIPGWGGVQLAEFLDPAGFSDQYAYSAATLRHDDTYDNNVITLPYDFQFVMTTPWTTDWPPYGSGRDYLLLDVLLYFGLQPAWPPPGVPEADDFVVKQYPNPFNPSTRIEYRLPRNAELTIKIYDLRGQVVRTLVDQVMPAGAGHVTWDGRDEAGGQVASGVYFCETRALGEVKVHKMALVR
jgi:hypothetical protein